MLKSEQMLLKNAIDGEYRISVRNKKTLQLEEVTCSAADVPDFLHCFSSQWQFCAVEKTAFYAWQDIERAKLEEAKTINSITRNKASTYFPPIIKQSILNNSNWATCVCPETGITFKIDFPFGFKMPIMHPFTIEANVKEVFAKIAKDGKNAQDILSTESLAGCLISVLRANDLLLCKNPIDANKYLKQASSAKLAFCIRWFLSRSTFQDFPKLSLLDLHLNHDWFKPQSLQKLPDAEILLENYLRVCQGEIMAEQGYVKIPEKKPAKSIKVYTDTVKQEFSGVREAKERGKVLLAQIEKEFGGLAPALVFLKKVNSYLIALAFLSNENKQKIARSLKETFADFEPAAELAEIFSGSKTSNLQDDLGSFSIDLEKEQNPNKKLKTVDFLSKLVEKEA